MLKKIGLSLAFLTLAGILTYWLAGGRSIEQPGYPIARTVKYSLIVENPSSKLIDQSRFWLYAPLSLGAYQNLEEIQVSHPYQIETDKMGNQRLVFELKKLPPYTKKTYTITAKVRLSSAPNLMPDINPEEFLSEEPFVEISDKRIKQLASRLLGETPQQTVTNIYRWVTSNIKNRGYLARDRGAVQTLLTKTGDCTDAMYLFSALSRANRIPSRNLAGFMVMENALLKSRDYHNWVEVLIDGQWRLVDPDKRVFMERESDYIAMSVLGGVEAKEAPERRLFFAGTNNIRLTMN